jgi:translation initiation factor 3 subunit E
MKILLVSQPVITHTPKSLNGNTMNSVDADSNKAEGAPMAKYDLTNTLAPFMDLHFMFPLIDFLSNNEMYDEKQLMAAKLELLKPTNMADFAVEIHQSLHNSTKVPAEFEKRRAVILEDLSKAKGQCKPMLQLLEDQDKIVALQNDGLLIATYLEQNHGVTNRVF